MNSLPIRIQRSRKKGWRMPENTVSCTRPGMFGNPFMQILDLVYINSSHRRKILSPWVLFSDGPVSDGMAIKLFRECISNPSAFSKYPSYELVHKAYFERMRDNLPQLKGKNLACFCPLDSSCHVDILLELANC